MKVICAMCQKEEEITKLHKDYQKLSANPAAPYFCPACSRKLSSGAERERRRRS